jgi:hypothetical protein
MGASATEVRNGFQMRVHPTTFRTAYLNTSTIQILNTYHEKLQQLNNMENWIRKGKSHSSEYLRGSPSLPAGWNGGFFSGVNVTGSRS